ncbi:MAG: hypothetical protein GF388_05145 [Candidatus Aegiribacteria sp.]|nr:hypothetical protein [Candidatus Aegiribacteria sp.]
MYEILNTIPRFFEYWRSYSGQPIEEQVKGWENEYMSSWPEILEKQKENYRRDEIDWEAIAQDKIFPDLPAAIEKIEQAYTNLQTQLPKIHGEFTNEFNLTPMDILYCLYVGIGCGAGWLTEISGRMAILFGLEMIAECGWEGNEQITGLACHELGHAYHRQLRSDSGSKEGGGPIWRLYLEGFACYCEQTLRDTGVPHESYGINPPDWSEWCSSNREMLAREFLDRIDSEADVRPFFGSWYDLYGYRQTGYYLGQEVVRNMVSAKGLAEVATLDSVDRECRYILEGFIGEG